MQILSLVTTFFTEKINFYLITENSPSCPKRGQLKIKLAKNWADKKIVFGTNRGPYNRWMWKLFMIQIQYTFEILICTVTYTCSLYLPYLYSRVQNLLTQFFSHNRKVVSPQQRSRGWRKSHSSRSVVSRCLSPRGGHTPAM